jgi:hypothetical protein
VNTITPGTTKNSFQKDLFGSACLPSR